MTGTGTATRDVLLDASGVVKRFGGVTALRGASLMLDTGEVHAVVGENGAGKSTLIKVIAGVHQPDAGELRWQGRPVVIGSLRESMALGIRVMFQQLNVIEELTVAENLTLGLEPVRAGFVDRRAARQRAAEALQALGVPLSPNRRVAQLSVAQRQLMEIARAVSLDARLVIMDEPTASLGTDEVERLFEVIGGLRRRGVTVAYISHRLEEVLTVSDRITVLRDGETVGTLETAGTTADGIVSLMVGDRHGHDFRKEVHIRAGTPRLEVRGLSTETGVRDASFSVQPGEVLGVYGLLGSGRTELARALFGADRVLAGEVRVDGRVAALSSPSAAVAQGIGLVPEDRIRQGLFTQLSIRDNVTSAAAGLYSRRGWLNRRHQLRMAERVVAELGVKAASVETPVRALSGGNQQKVVIGRWLVRDTRVLLLDDPTVGVDVAAKDEIYRLISRLTSEGTCVVLFSSELPEILGLADRVMVLHDRRIAAVLDRDAATPARVVHLAVIGPAEERAA